MATPRVMSISGIAICPTRSMAWPSHSGTVQPSARKTEPRMVPQTSGSRIAVTGLPPPATTQTPKVKEMIAITAKITTAKSNPACPKAKSASGSPRLPVLPKVSGAQ